MRMLLFACALVAALILTYLYIALSGRHRLRRKVQRGFGQEPPTAEGRRAARLFWQSYRETLHDTGLVDDITWHDLDMDEVYAWANGCHSAAGDARLYSLLHLSGAGAQNLREIEELTALLAQNPAWREEVQFQLARLGRREGNAVEQAVFHSQNYNVGGRVWLYRLLAFLPLAGGPVWLLAGWQYGLAVFGALCLANLLFYMFTRMRDEPYFVAVGYLAVAMRYAKRLAGMLQRQHPEMAARLDSSVKALGPLYTSCGLLYMDEWLLGLGIPNPLAFFQLPLLRYARIAAQLPRYSAGVLHMYQQLGNVDVAAANASLRARLPVWCRPSFSGELMLGGDTLYHPLLDEPVANTAHFTRGALFTGSNASGKSTFLKAVAINAIFAQGLGTCFAAGFTLRPGAVASSMAVKDNVVEGDSYFVAEIKSLRRLLRLAATGDTCYLFIDEILRGTNTVERIAASAEVLRWLSGRQNALCFAATHDIELTALLADLYENYHFRESVGEDGVRFDYALHPGPATSRNAILLLDTLGFPSAVVSGAATLAGGFDKTGHWQK